jgi:hypothetical protein
MEDFSTTYPTKPEDFEEKFGVNTPAIFSPEEWNRMNPGNPLVCIEDAESYVICYVPQSRADAVMLLLQAGAHHRELQRTELKALLFPENADG